MIDTKRGFTSVFTLNLKPTLHEDEDRNIYGYLYDPNQLLHTQNAGQHSWNYNYNLTPGILVKYFNGVEQEIPFKDIFFRVDRFVISRDGYYFLIVGIIMEQKSEKKVELRHGIFLYQRDRKDHLKITLVKEIAYAERLNATSLEEGQ